MINFAVAMIQNYDIKVKNVHDYNEFVGAANLHADVSVIHYDELPPYGIAGVCGEYMDCSC